MASAALVSKAASWAQALAAVNRKNIRVSKTRAGLKTFMCCNRSTGDEAKVLRLRLQCAQESERSLHRVRDHNVGIGMAQVNRLIKRRIGVVTAGNRPQSDAVESAAIASHLNHLDRPRRGQLVPSL